MIVGQGGVGHFLSFSISLLEWNLTALLSYWKIFERKKAYWPRFLATTTTSQHVCVYLLLTIKKFLTAAVVRQRSCKWMIGHPSPGWLLSERRDLLAFFTTWTPSFLSCNTIFRPLSSTRQITCCCTTQLSHWPIDFLEGKQQLKEETLNDDPIPTGCFGRQANTFVPEFQHSQWNSWKAIRRNCKIIPFINVNKQRKKEKAERNGREMLLLPPLSAKMMASFYLFSPKFMTDGWRSWAKKRMTRELIAK